MTVDGLTIVICAILFIATLTRSTVGFGDALIAMPLMAFFVDVKTAAPLMGLVSLTTATFIVVQDWREVRVKNALPLIIPAAVGVPLGVFFLKASDPKLIKALLAMMIMSFCLYSLFRPKNLELTTNRTAPVFGFVAGLLGGAFNTQGPPIVVYGMLRNWPPVEFRATAQGFFLPTTTLLMVCYSTAGFWTAEVFKYYVIAAPLVVTAILVGRTLNRRLPHQHFARVIFTLLLGVACLLLYRAITA